MMVVFYVPLYRFIGWDWGGALLASVSFVLSLILVQTIIFLVKDRRRKASPVADSDASGVSG